MNPESTPHKVDTPYGVLYIAVMRSEEHSFHDSERGNVTELRPRIRVASDSLFEADPSDADHWTIRGRAYAVHETYQFNAAPTTYRNGFTERHWRSGDTPYRGGFRNDKRRPVEIRTATYDLMEKAVTDALDSFAADHPDWAKFSEYLYWEGKKGSARMRVIQAQEECRKAETEVDAFTIEAGALRRGLPDTYFTMEGQQA